MKQVITIKPDGTMAGLQHKPGKGVDLRQFGPAKIERASEIVFNEDTQKWNIRILCEPWGGEIIFLHGHGVLEFQEYDDAVTYEIEILNKARLAGVLS